MKPLKAGIIGVAGYTGAELVRLLAAHPRLELTWVAGRSSAGKPLATVLPHLRGLSRLGALEIEAFDPARADEVAKRIDVVFTALPHAESARIGAALYRAGLQVVDLSADFRLRDVATYERWYGPHPEPELLEHARYGLVEWRREELRDARLIAAPGCYPTSAILALGPLLKAGLVEPQGLIIDSKSGVSGAGRSASASTHFPECGEGLRPYKVAGAHRHTGEIEQELGRIAGTDLRVLFTPQLVPMTRGILTVAYAQAKPGVTLNQCREAACSQYDTEMVTVLGPGELPDTLWVRGSARALVSYAFDERTQRVLAFCAEDNLAKGASAQAIQALNVARGWPESLGLPLVAQFP